MTTEPPLHDIIADVHGHADALAALLAKMGYRIEGNSWRHPERQAVFVGDLVDRGPEQLATFDIVRRMVDAGDARCVMGNHEYNAICWATPTEDGRDHLRRHDEQHAYQHSDFLEAVEGKPGLHRELVEWMWSLPLWLDLGGIRVVHACWDRKAMDVLAPILTADHRLTPTALFETNRKGTPEHAALEIVLKGLEAKLPEGVYFKDKYGHRRDDARVRWWDPQADTFRKAALGCSGILDRIPDDPIDASWTIPYDDEKPVFFGHYWLEGAPAIVSPNKACLDFSVANKGVLCAYRHNGETVLDPANLVHVGPDSTEARMQGLARRVRKVVDEAIASQPVEALLDRARTMRYGPDPLDDCLGALDMDLPVSLEVPSNALRKACPPTFKMKVGAVEVCEPRTVEVVVKAGDTWGKMGPWMKFQLKKQGFVETKFPATVRPIFHVSLDIGRYGPDGETTAIWRLEPETLVIPNETVRIPLDGKGSPKAVYGEVLGLTHPSAATEGGTVDCDWTIARIQERDSGVHGEVHIEPTGGQADRSAASIMHAAGRPVLLPLESPEAVILDGARSVHLPKHQSPGFAEASRRGMLHAVEEAVRSASLLPPPISSGLDRDCLGYVVDQTAGSRLLFGMADLISKECLNLQDYMKRIEAIEAGSAIEEADLESRPLHGLEILIEGVTITAEAKDRPADETASSMDGAMPVFETTIRRPDGGRTRVDLHLVETDPHWALYALDITEGSSSRSVSLASLDAPNADHHDAAFALCVGYFRHLRETSKLEGFDDVACEGLFDEDAVAKLVEAVWP